MTLHFRLLTLLLLAAVASIPSRPARAQEGSPRWSKNPSWADEPSARVVDSPRERPQRSENRTRYTPFSPGSNNLSIDVGQIFLLGDKGEYYSDTIGFQIHNVHAVSEIFGLDTAFSYSSHGPTENGETGYSLAALKLGLRSNLAWYDKAIPYGTFGLGFFRPSETLATSSVEAILFGLYLGAGINLEITDSMFFGASLTMHDMFGTRKRDSGGTIREVDGGFASFLVSAGMSF